MKTGEDHKDYRKSDLGILTLQPLQRRLASRDKVGFNR
jgi:hypothetical protein